MLKFSHFKNFGSNFTSSFPVNRIAKTIVSHKETWMFFGSEFVFLFIRLDIFIGKLKLNPREKKRA